MKYIITVLVNLACIVAFGQCNIALNGKVVDDHSQEPLAYVAIQINNSITVLTNELGEFNINNQCKGEVRLKLAYIGYEKYRVKFTLSKDTSLLIPLHSLVCSIDEIDVHGHREGTDIFCQESLTEEQESRKISESIADQLKDIDGVNSISTGATISKPSINGFHSQRISIIDNGVALSSQSWGMEHAPEISRGLYEDMMVIKGAQNVKYGTNNIGGAIILEPHSLEDTSLERNYNYIGTGFNTNHGGVHFIGGVQRPLKKKVGWSISGGIKKQGNYATPKYRPENTAMEEASVRGVLAYRLSENTTVDIYSSNYKSKFGVYSGAHIGNLTDLEQAMQMDVPPQEFQASFSYRLKSPYQDVFHNTSGIKLKKKGKKGSSFVVHYARQYNRRSEFDAHDGDEPEAAVDFFLTTHTLNLNHSILDDSSNIWEYGLQGEHKKNTYNGFYFIPNFLQYSVGGYGFRRVYFDNATFELGARLDMVYLNSFIPSNGGLSEKPRQFINPTVSLSLNKKISERTYLVANTGYNWRAPTVNELYANGVHHGAASFEQGDSTIKEERSLQSQVVWHYDNLEKFGFEVGLFANYIFDYINLIPTGENVLTIRGAFPRFDYEARDAIFRGVNVSINSHLFGHFSYRGSGSMIYANGTDGTFLSFIPPVNVRNKLRYHNNNLGSLEHFYGEVELYTELKQSRIDLSREFLDAPPAYTLLNAAFGFEYHNMNLSLSATNLLNKKYRNYLNRFRYFIDEQGVSLKINLLLKF